MASNLKNLEARLARTVYSLASSAWPRGQGLRPVLKHASWLIPLAYGTAHLIFPPRAHNSHAIMYALIEEAHAHNTLEWFHALYSPTLSLVKAAYRALGFQGPALLALQLLSLFAALWHLRLIHRIALQVTKNKALASSAALLATASINLWAWSMQTTAYTLAAAFMLGAILVLIKTPRYSQRKSALLGLLTAIAAGYDIACLLLAFVVLADISMSNAGAVGKKKASFIYLSSLTITLALGYIPLLIKLNSLGYIFPTTLPQFLDRLPSDIIPLSQSKSLWRQLSGLKHSTAPLDAPYWLLAVFFGLSGWLAYRSETLTETQRRLLRSGALLFFSLFFFFLFCDPHNRFLYSCGLLFPAISPLLLIRSGRPITTTVLLWLALVAKNFAYPADYVPENNAGFAEAEFLEPRIARQDLLVSISQPDWLFSYAVLGKIPVAQILWPEDANTSFGHILVTAGMPLNELMRSRLCSGGKVLVGTGDLFSNPAIPKPRMDEYVNLISETMQKDFFIGEPVASPQDMKYYPVTLRKKELCR